MKLTKERQKGYVARYLESNCQSVSQFYKTGGSAEKLRDEQRIIEYMKNVGGYGYKIIGGNCFHFTAGWMLNDKNGKTWLYIETHCRTYAINMCNL